MKHVYVMSRASGAVKIGASASLEGRRYGLMTEWRCLVYLEYATILRADWEVVEDTAHKLIADHHLIGEWFSVEPKHAILAIDRAIRIATKIESDVTLDIAFRKNLSRFPLRMSEVSKTVQLSSGIERIHRPTPFQSTYLLRIYDGETIRYKDMDRNARSMMKLHRFISTADDGSVSLTERGIAATLWVKQTECLK